jgi:Xaa-Pro dipeptidase
VNAPPLRGELTTLRLSAAERVARMQEALRADGVDAWLLYDFHGTNPIARAVLDMERAPNAAKTTRRWFYLVPARGEPRKLVHRIEPRVLDHLPGSERVYLAWRELADGVGGLVRDAASSRGSDGGGPPAIAMEYSPGAALPYVSRVDAGTVEMVRGAGARVLSSADLAQRFEGSLTPDERLDHVRTGRILDGLITTAFERARDAAARGAPVSEVVLQRFLLERYADEGLIASDPPIVAVNAHSADPHFTTSPATDLPARAGDFLLIDAWAKRNGPGAVYADYTRVAWLGPAAPETHRTVFEAVRDARDAAIERVRTGLESGAAVRGCDVDDAARDVIRARGYGDRFLHRLGHSIGREVHANGVHLDNLETRDERRLIEGTLVSVEPGIYLEAFGVRCEVDLLVDGGRALVTTEPIQRELPALLP